jgi:nitrogenase iron protein NifH
MQIGCDPKADSTSNLTGRAECTTVLDCIEEKGERVQLRDVVIEGYNGVLCVEAGGPTPGIGCAGLGIIAAFKKLEDLRAYEIYAPDIVLYDVLGDVVCGGFAMPMRGEYADNVFIVTSGEAMALFAARNIALAVENFSSRGYAQYSGIILNSRNVKDEAELAEKLAHDTDSEIVARISRSHYVQLAEEQGKTVIEAFPGCDIALEYRALADKLIELCGITEKAVAV